MQRQLTYAKREPQAMSLKEKALYSLVAAACATGVVVGGYKIVRHFISNSAEKKSFEFGTSTTHAKQLRMALENDGKFGVDVNEIRTVLRQIRNQEEMAKVSIEYQKLYGRILYHDMSEKLDPSEYTEFLLIMSGKPQTDQQGITPEQYRAWAMRLNYAFINTWGWGLPGTDEDAIKAVFLEIPTKADYKKVEQAYYSEYGVTLWKDLQLELEVWEIADMMEIVNKKP